jgi:hypothetical protein
MRVQLEKAAMSALLFVMAAAPGVAHGSTQPPVPGIAGGYQSTETNNPDVRAAARFAVASVERRARLRRVDAAQQQVVAGMNYRLDLTTSSGRRWRVTVYRPLRGRMQLTSRERLTRR